MLNKLANSIEMSFDISDSEKKLAEDAINLVLKVVNLLSLAKDHLDIMYNPFKKNNSVSTESLIRSRGKLNIYKQQVKKNFEEVKLVSFYAVTKLNNFKTDNHILELINSFKDSMSSLEKQVVIFLDILDDFKSEEFRDSVLAAIESIRKEILDLNNLVKDRIVTHIDENIIGKDWTSSIDNKLKDKVKEEVPLIIQLTKERNEVAMPQLQKSPQELNAGNIQKIYYPTSYDKNLG